MHVPRIAKQSNQSLILSNTHRRSYGDDAAAQQHPAKPTIIAFFSSHPQPCKPASATSQHFTTTWPHAQQPHHVLLHCAAALQCMMCHASAFAVAAVSYAQHLAPALSCCQPAVSHVLLLVARLAPC
jgi:hypothetical protein